MGKHLEKRRRLFKKFSGQLLALRDQSLIVRDFQYTDPYLCPICLREFSEDHLNESKHHNFLTAEDAPPESLGGSKIALTCKECNNTCGHEIDCHLVGALRSIDDSYFYKGTKRRVTVEFEGKRLPVDLESLGDGTLSAYHPIKHSDPTLLDKFIFGVKNGTVGPLLNFQPPARKIIQARINYALLKTNYILTFAKFGYLFLLDQQYNGIREQLLHPERVIFPWQPFVKDQFQPENVGTYYVLNRGIESILNVFALRTAYSETIVGGFIQSPDTTIEEFGRRIDQGRNTHQEVFFDTSNYNPDADLFADIPEMRKVINWMKSA